MQPAGIGTALYERGYAVRRCEVPSKSLNRTSTTAPVLVSAWPSDAHSICNTSASRLLVCGSSKQQQIPIRIFDDKIPGAPRLLLQFLAKGNASGLKLKKQ